MFEHVYSLTYHNDCTASVIVLVSEWWPGSGIEY